MINYFLLIADILTFPFLMEASPLFNGKLNNNQNAKVVKIFRFAKFIFYDYPQRGRFCVRRLKPMVNK
jgi:hypothetical protein